MYKLLHILSRFYESKGRAIYHRRGGGGGGDGAGGDSFLFNSPKNFTIPPSHPPHAAPCLVKFFDTPQIGDKQCMNLPPIPGNP